MLSRRWALPPVVIADGTIEALKWMGIVLMMLDHANKFLYGGQFPWMFQAGRVVMPLFTFVLAYNLSRPDALARGAYRRTAVRLCVYGLVATLPFVAIKGAIVYGWPLNILFTLLLSTLIIWMLDQRKPRMMWLIVPLFVLGGMLPEFWHMGVAGTVAAWYFCRNPRVESLAVWVLMLAALWLINQNYYALAVLPLLYVATRFNFHVPRYRHVFYVFYPAHLAVIWVLQVLAR